MMRGHAMEYNSISKMSEKWGISTRRIRILCTEGRIPGAYKKNVYWVIPENASKPKDERIKSGKYIKYCN
jgi:hypothetical protein